MSRVRLSESIDHNHVLVPSSTTLAVLPLASLTSLTPLTLLHLPVLTSSISRDLTSVIRINRLLLLALWLLLLLVGLLHLDGPLLLALQLLLLSLCVPLALTLLTWILISISLLYFPPTVLVRLTGSLDTLGWGLPLPLPLELIRVLPLGIALLHQTLVVNSLVLIWGSSS